MNLRDMVAEWLRQNGYDGLYHGDTECGCGLDDLMPCSEPGLNCEPGHVVATDNPDGCGYLVYPGKAERSDDITDAEIDEIVAQVKAIDVTRRILDAARKLQDCIITDDEGWPHFTMEANVKEFGKAVQAGIEAGLYK